MKQSLLFVALLSGMSAFGASSDAGSSDGISAFGTSGDEVIASDPADFNKVQAIYRWAAQREKQQRSGELGNVPPLSFLIESSLWKPVLDKTDKLLMEINAHPLAWPGLKERLRDRQRDLYEKGMNLSRAMAEEGENVKGVRPLSLLSKDESNEYKRIESYLSQARDDPRFFNHQWAFDEIKSEVMPLVEPLLKLPMYNEL